MRVTGITVQQRVGNDIFNTESGPSSTYVVVRYSETNTSNETLSVIGSPFKLIDARSVVSTKHSGPPPRSKAPRSLDFMPQLQPGIEKVGVAVFELPDAAATGAVQLEFHERGVFNSGVEIIRVTLPAEAAAPTEEAAAE